MALAQDAMANADRAKHSADIDVGGRAKPPPGCGAALGVKRPFAAGYSESLNQQPLPVSITGP